MNLPNIGSNRGKPGGLRDGTFLNHIVRSFLVIIVRESETVVEHRQIQTYIKLCRTFPTQVHIGNIAVGSATDQRPVQHVIVFTDVGYMRIVTDVVVSRDTVAGSQLQHVKVRHRLHKRLFTHYPSS